MLILGNTAAAVLDAKTAVFEEQADLTAVRVMPGVAQQVVHDRPQQGGVVQAVIFSLVDTGEIEHFFLHRGVPVAVLLRCQLLQADRR